MKHFFTFLFAISTFHLFGGQLIDATIMHDGLEREYSVYLPDAYEPGMEWPLVFNFHGIGSNSVEQTLYTGFTAVADTAHFILCIPNGTPVPGGSGFGWDVNFPGDFSDIDDVGFISKLIDVLYADYNINPGKVYATGMSNGGYLSYKLACELTDRFQAIASVTGSIVPAEFGDCMPPSSFPIMQIHGTADPTVPYDGSLWATPIEDVVNFWAQHNNCGNTPDTTYIDEGPLVDNCSAIKISYTDCDTDREVIFYKIVGGGHTWPGAFIPIGVTNQDINASVEIWNFFNQYENPNITISNKNITNDLQINLFPNPVVEQLTIQADVASLLEFQIYNTLGQLVFTKKEIDNNTYTVTTQQLPIGIYFIDIQTDKGSFKQQFIKQ